MELTEFYKEFFNSEITGGLIVVLVILLSLLLANSPWQDGDLKFLNFDIAGHSIVH